MNMIELITKKKEGEILNGDELKYFVDGYTRGDIPDYQASAFLMAVYFQGMDAEETYLLTKAMIESGETLDLSGIKGVKLDKHSTGGVGDKTSLIVAPIVAARGGKVAKMSGRGLGHTGGTIDKLESIDGFKTSISIQEFINNVNDIGLSIIGQTGELVPADKKLYRLRDVTATVDSLPLIASSIMSKKIAAGADAVILDIKYGSGAFMKDIESARELGESMKEIGARAGKKVGYILSDMNEPEGRAIGNSLEVIEAVEVLKGGGETKLRETCVGVAAAMLEAGGFGSHDECVKMSETSIDDGSAFEKLKQMVERQGGRSEALDDTGLFKRAEIQYRLLAEADGVITGMNTEEIGLASVALGAGRKKLNDDIDYSAGIIVEKKTGEAVKKGDCLAVLHTSDKAKLSEGAKLYLSALNIE